MSGTSRNHCVKNQLCQMLMHSKSLPNTFNTLLSFDLLWVIPVNAFGFYLLSLFVYYNYTSVKRVNRTYFVAEIRIEENSYLNEQKDKINFHMKFISHIRTFAEFSKRHSFALLTRKFTYDNMRIFLLAFIVTVHTLIAVTGVEKFKFWFLAIL